MTTDIADQQPPNIVAERRPVGEFFTDISEAKGVQKTLKADLIDSQPLGIRDYLAKNPPALEIRNSLDGGDSNGQYAQDVRKIYIASSRPKGTYGQTLNPGVTWSVSETGKTASDAISRTFTHEVGHHVYYSHEEMIRPLVTQIVDSKKHNPLTDYGKDRRGIEYFAETFSAYVYHRDLLETLDPVGYNLISDVIGKVGIDL